MPVSEVARWPAEDVRLLRHYFAKQPAPMERVEILLARFLAVYVNAHSPKGAKSVDTADFLAYRDPWPDLTTVDLSRYSDVDREVLRNFS